MKMSQFKTDQALAGNVYFAMHRATEKMFGEGSANQTELGLWLLVWQLALAQRHPGHPSNRTMGCALKAYIEGLDLNCLWNQ